MSMILRARVKLTGHNVHEQAVPLAPGGRLPHIGDVIAIPLGDRVVRACVTLTTPPMCRGNDSIMYVVYASEVTEAADLPHPSSSENREQATGQLQARSLA